MIQEGERHLKELAGLLDQARELDLHHIPSRYPNGIPSGYPHQFYSKKVANQALVAPDKIFSSIRRFYQTREEKEILKIDDY